MRTDLHCPIAPSAARARRLSLADAQALCRSTCPQTRHARRRAAQRNLSTTAVEYVLTWGRPIQRTGVDFYVLRKKDIPAQHRHLPAITRLAGVVVIAARDGEVITTYRNARALREIQRKMKYRFTPGPNLICADIEADIEEDAVDDEVEGHVETHGSPDAMRSSSPWMCA